jgi:hypothetical protein
MHYEDNLVEKNQELKIIIYIHEVCGSVNNEDYEVCITQILSAKHAHPYALQKIINNIEYIIDNDFIKNEDLKFEEYYIINFKFDTNKYRYKISSIEKADITNELNLLH